MRSAAPESTGARVSCPPTSRRRARALRRAAAAICVAVALVACTTDGDGEPSPTAEPPAVQAAPGVGVQLFQWTWDAIARECTDVLGPAGYGWVLTSPPQEHIIGEEWWTAYQPVSYLVESRLGTREEFAAMVQACDTAGVAVVADAVINHMTGQDEPGVGWAESPYEHYEYPGLWSDAEGDFHHCGLTPNDDIAVYSDAEQVRTCELVNLADLATGTDRVRDRLTEYLEDLLSLGVAGFRIDAAKHMAPEDVGAVVDPLPEGTVVVQEVIDAAEEPISSTDYLGNGAVFDFQYGRDLAALVKGGSVVRVPALGSSQASPPSEQAVVFVENHDTERNGSTLTYKDDADHVLGNVLMLAGTHGTPVVYSGYAFLQRDTGPVQDERGAVLDAECVPEPGPGQRYDDGEWVCQHRWPATLGMVGWHAAVGDAPLTEVWEGRRAVALTRGERGFVAVNGGASEITETVPTTLPPGAYCDVVAGPPVDGECVGRVVEVADDGTVEVRLDGDSALALHVGAVPQG